MHVKKSRGGLEFSEIRSDSFFGFKKYPIQSYPVFGLKKYPTHSDPFLGFSKISDPICFFIKKISDSLQTDQIGSRIMRKNRYPTQL